MAEQLANLFVIFFPKWVDTVALSCIMYLLTEEIHMNNDNGFAITNNQPKTCDELHRECINFAKHTPNHKRAVFQCQLCEETFDSEDYRGA